MPPAQASFRFVDHSAIDKKARRNIRSHVMKGKNVGKVRTPRRHLATANTYVNTAPKPEPKDTASSQQLAKRRGIDFDLARSSPKLIVQLGNELSGISTPCIVSPNSRQFIHEFMYYAADSIYPPQLCLEPYDMVNDVWIRYMLIDEAYYHCLVALSEACINFLVRRERDSAEFNHHMTRGLQLINAKLSGVHALSDIAISTVILLCLVSSIRQIPVQTKVHFDGLCRMIKLRGGLGQLSGNPILAEKSQRLDIELALQLGCPTQLGASSKRLDAILPNYHDPTFEFSSPLATAILHGDLRVLKVAQEIIKVARILNSTVPTKRLYPLEYQGIITSLTYRLLDIEPINGYQLSNAVSKAVHRGLLAFMLTFVAQINRQRRIAYPVLKRSLAEALDHPEFQANIDPPTHVWLLIVAGIYVLDKNISLTWLRPRLVDAMSVFGATDWEFGRSLLATYPWVDSLHDRTACLIWHDCFGHAEIHQ